MSGAGSDTASRLPSVETARTFPVTADTTEAVDPVLAAGSIIINPFGLPANARPPAGAKISEFGKCGKSKMAPTVFVAPVISVANAPQLNSGFPSVSLHWLLVTRAVGVAAVVGRFT